MTFRDDLAPCPRCQRALIPQPGGDGSRLWCEDCRGVLIPTADLEHILEVTLPAGEPGERQCPRCAAKLATFTLFGVELDRCIAHGVWFDPKEYVRMLDVADGKDPDNPGEPNIVRRLLHVLYGDPRDA